MSKIKKILGFTLIEIMISVAIFAVIASIMGPALFQFLDVREKVAIKQARLEGLQKTFLFLANDFRYAANRLGKDEYGDRGKATMSIGDDSLVDFTAAYPDLNLDGTNVPRRVRWILEDKVLKRLQSPVMDPDGDTRLMRQSLLSEVVDVDIELSVIEEGRDNTSKKWDEETRLPDKVSVTIKMENGQEYQRVFSMLGGDNLDAIAASSNSQLPINGSDDEEQVDGAPNNEVPPDRIPQDEDVN